MTKKKFVPVNYGEDQTVQLSRKQILQIAEVVNRFEDVEDFCLRISNSSGIGPSVHFSFTLDLAGDRQNVTVDATDVSKW